MKPLLTDETVLELTRTALEVTDDPGFSHNTCVLCKLGSLVETLADIFLEDGEKLTFYDSAQGRFAKLLSETRVNHEA